HFEPFGYIRGRQKQFSSSSFVAMLTQDQFQKFEGVEGMISPSSMPSSDKQPSILIVDDDPVTRELLRRSLSADGFACDVANNGESALEMAEKRPYCIVLSDV